MVDRWLTQLLFNNRSWALEVRSSSELPHSRSQNISVVRIGGRRLFVARLHHLAISFGHVLGDAHQFRSDSDHLDTTEMASRCPLDSLRSSVKKQRVADQICNEHEHHYIEHKKDEMPSFSISVTWDRCNVSKLSWSRSIATCPRNFFHLICKFDTKRPVRVAEQETRDGECLNQHIDGG